MTLSPRQREVLALMSSGLRAKQIADRMGVSYGTVRTHTQAILRRLKARSLPHAVAIGMRSELIE